MTPSERRGVGEAGLATHAGRGIAPATWLWLVAVGLAFWLAVAQGVLWLV